jgi:dihydroxyacetone kinase-like protein
MTVRKEDVLSWLGDLQRVYAENKPWLTELDSAIGDADHGTNMDRGFTAVQMDLTENPQADIPSILKNTAMVLIRSVGGAAGPLYGTFFLRAGAACEGKMELGPADVVAMFHAGIEGVEQRGKAVPGDKTMVDVLLPALAAMRASLEKGDSLAQILDRGVSAAETAMRGTIPMQARKGRASYLGPRSIGHQDPGATSSYLLLQAAANAWRFLA